MPITRDDINNWLQAFSEILAEQKSYLTELDSAIGDADHGANMDRGFQAVMAKLPTLNDNDIGTVFKNVGMTLLSTVGGAGGPLYATIFINAGNTIKGKMELSLEDVRRLNRRILAEAGLVNLRPKDAKYQELTEIAFETRDTPLRFFIPTGESSATEPPALTLDDLIPIHKETANSP